MNNKYMITTVQEKFENFGICDVFFESTETIKPSSDLVLVKYVGGKTDYKFLGQDGKRNNGHIRCYIWANNPTKNYELIDSISNFMVGNYKNICIKEPSVIQAPSLNEGLFMSLISFPVEAINI